MSLASLTRASILVAIVTAPGWLMANGDFCNSTTFREAFLAGQDAIAFDYRDVSSKLIALGNDALPCLQSIAESGGEVYGIDGCIEGPHGCELWAVRAIGQIGTREAMQFLTDYLESDRASRPLVAAINHLRIQKVTNNRAALLKLIKHRDPEVQVAALVALGAIGDPSDFEAMLDTALSLPDDYLYKGSQAFELLGDPRAIEPLARRAKLILDPIQRDAVEGRVKRLRSESDSQSE